MAYDIFISFKKTDQGHLTEDFELAQKLHKILENKLNYKVFFSETEIHTNKDSKFGNIIAAALDESKILIYVCTNPDYLNTSYVSYEWSSFHDEIICGRKDGEIYGLVKGVTPDKLPFNLRRYNLYDFDNEIDKLISCINAYFKRDDCPLEKTIDDFNKEQFIKYREYSEEDYVSESFSEYINLVSTEEVPLAVVSYQKEIEAFNAFYAKSKKMSLTGENVVYLANVSELETVLSVLDEEKYLVFVNSVKTISELEVLYQHISINANLKFLIGVHARETELLSILGDSSMVYKMGILNDSETQCYVEKLCSEYHIPLSSQLLSILLLPTLEEFRTPKMLKIIMMNLKKYENYLDYDYNITDIFEIIDDYILRIDERLSSTMQKLIFKAMKKGINKFSLMDIEEFKESVEKLYQLGFISKNGNYYHISSKDYYNYKIAETYFDENGINYSVDFFNVFKESIPYYIYLYFLSVGTLIIDNFELTSEDIFSLLQLFISEEGFEKIVLTHKYDQEVLSFLKHARRTGLYSMAMHIIGIFETNQILSTEEFDYLSEKIYIKFLLDGNVLETEETHGNIYYRKGYCYYCLDDYQNSLMYFELAFNKMLEKDEIDYSLLFHYVELLLDVGNHELTNELLSIYEQNIGNSKKYESEYYYTKALIAIDHLEFALAIDYLKVCVENCNKNVNIRRLQIYYGELGRVFYYLGDYTEAKKYFLRNYYIAKILDDYHGLGISTKMLARISLNELQLEQCYQYLSYAENYSEKIGNYWRWSKIMLMIDILTKTFDRLDKVDKIIEQIDTPMYRYDAYFLKSQLYHVLKDDENALKYANMANELTLQINNKRAFEFTKAWLSYLSCEIYNIPPNQEVFFSDLLKAVEYIRNNEFEIKQQIDYYKFEELSTERLYLRMIKVADAKDVFEYASDFQNTKYVCWTTHKNLNSTYKYIEQIHSLENIGYSMTWGISLKDEEKLIGTVDLVYNENYQEVEIGYIINRKYWGHGYAKEAVLMVKEFAKNVLHLKKIVGVAFKVNEASNAVLQRCGFNFVKEIPNYHNKPLIIDKRGMYYELILD